MRISRLAGTAAAVFTFAAATGTVEAQYPGEVHVPRSVLERYVGEYIYPAGNTTLVVLKGDTLFRAEPGRQIPFVPISNTLFKLGPMFTAEFVIDKAGAVTQVLSDGMATEFRLPRKVHGARVQPAAAPAPPVVAVHVPRSVLERYVGEYEFVPGQMDRTDLMVTIRLRGDTLTREISGVPEVALTPLSPTRFRVGNISAEAEFVIDHTGGVVHIMGSGSRQMRARRKPKD